MSWSDRRPTQPPKLWCIGGLLSLLTLALTTSACGECDHCEPWRRENPVGLVIRIDAPVPGYLEFEGEIQAANQHRPQKVRCRLDVDLNADVTEACRNREIHTLIWSSSTSISLRSLDGALSYTGTPTITRAYDGDGTLIALTEVQMR